MSLSMLLGGGSSSGSSTVTGLDVDTTSGTGTDPVLPNGSGNIVVTGAQVASGTIGANVIRTNSPSPSTVTTQIQQAGTAAASTTTQNGVSHFNSSQFTVSSGFVSLSSTINLERVRAWVNFNAAGTIQDSYNVTSVTKTATGTYTVNFTTAIGNANYSAVITPRDTSGNLVVPAISSQTTTALSMQLRGGSALILGLLVTLQVPIDPTGGVNVIVCGTP